VSTPRVSMSGGAQMRTRLERLAKRFPDDIARGMFQEGEVEATEVKRRTPVDRGTLRGTVRVVGPFREGRRIWVLIVCGGPAAPYAIFVHENLTAVHPVGQAKFLESVILESRPYMAQRVAKRIELNKNVLG
jgi:hypothetical protein